MFSENASTPEFWDKQHNYCYIHEDPGQWVTVTLGWNGGWIDPSKKVVFSAIQSVARSAGMNEQSWRTKYLYSNVSLQSTPRYCWVDKEKVVQSKK